MKVMIEIDVPDGQDIPKTSDILRLTNPDWIASWWHIDDVKGLNKKLTNEECRDVLRLVDSEHDANIGINWDFIQYYIDAVIEEREELA